MKRAIICLLLLYVSSALFAAERQLRSRSRCTAEF